MPLEIKELQISVTVNQPSAQGGTPAPNAQAGGADDAKAIVQQCIDEVMTIINNKRER